MKKILILLTAAAMILTPALSAAAEEVDEAALAQPEATWEETLPPDEEPAVDSEPAPVGAEEDVAAVADPDDDPPAQPAYPEIRSIATAQGGFRISWNPIEGAAKYRLFVKFNGSSWIRVGDTAGLFLDHRNLADNTVYTYTVRGLDKNGAYMSLFKREGWTKEYFPSPTLLSVAPRGNLLRLSWRAVAGAPLYRVYRRGNAGWVKLIDTADAFYDDADVESGKSYTYTVRCFDETGAEAISYCDTRGKTGSFVDMPAITRTDVTVSGFKVSWTAVPGAAKYRLFTKFNGSGWIRVGDTAGLSLEHKNLLNATEYIYTVRALNAAGAYVSDCYRNNPPVRFMSVPVITSAVGAIGGVQLSWRAQQGVEQYRVYRRIGNSAWTVIENTVENTILDRNVTPNTAYTYTVRCLSADGRTLQSYCSLPGRTITYYEVPRIVSFDAIENGTKIEWASTGAPKYRLFVKYDGSSWQRVADTATTSINHTGLTAGKEYIYTVRALSESGAYLSGHNPAGWSRTYLGPIGISVASDNNSRMMIRWTKMENAVRYKVYRSIIGSNYVEIGDADNRFADSTWPRNMPYCYSVCAIGADGRSLTYFDPDAVYYYNGEIANGRIEYNHTQSVFVNGHPRQGYMNLGGKKYYYNSKGVLMKNGIVGTQREGYYYADENGVCCTSEKMRLAAEFVMKHCTGTTPEQRMKSGFNYLAKYFPYNRTYDHPKKASDIAPLAIDMFTNEKGNCYRYAASFACIAKVCGYRTRMVFGTTSGNPHGWTEVLVNGEWLICDVDANIPSYHKPDYAAYMMKKHFWQLTVQSKHEVTIDVNGKAVWH